MYADYSMRFSTVDDSKLFQTYSNKYILFV